MPPGVGARWQTRIAAALFPRHGFDSNLSAQKKAGVAVGVKAVASCYRMGVGGLHRVEFHECRDQHEQRRSWQMEVGEHRVDRAELVAGCNEDGRLARKRVEHTRLIAGALEQTQGGRANSNDAPTSTPRRREIARSC